MATGLIFFNYFLCILGSSKPLLGEQFWHRFPNRQAPTSLQNICTENRKRTCRNHRVTNVHLINQSEISQFTKPSQPQQTANNKIRGGCVCAAWRIGIRSGPGLPQLTGVFRWGGLLSVYWIFLIGLYPFRYVLR